MKKTITILASAFLLFSCESRVDSQQGTVDNSTIENQAKQTIITEITPLNQVGDIVASLPPANRITATIKASGAPFSAITLNNPLNAESYTTNFRKAINLGIYGTDLGYIGIYEREELFADHLQVIHDLATDLDLAHFINRERLQSMRDNGMLTDSIFALTGDVFRKMDIHLRDHERYSTSLLLMVGSWLEALHIAATVTYNSKFDNETLNIKIGEQKIILEQFIKLLNNFEGEPLFGQLIDNLTQLKLLYDGVDLDEELLAKAMVDTTGKYINTKSVDITDTQLAKIAIKLNEIRHSIIEPT
ncbi:MAG: hypothetical protein JKY42_06925 [Flavobacteriales bacterium]|nr:hypothetical protein [Flavobacteriales bacterium]